MAKVKKSSNVLADLLTLGQEMPACGQGFEYFECIRSYQQFVFISLQVKEHKALRPQQRRKCNLELALELFWAWFNIYEQ